MDQNAISSVVFDESKKSEIEKEVANTIYDAADNGQIKIEEIKGIAEALLPEFEKVTNTQEYISFLESAKSKWNWFGPLVMKYGGQVQRAKEEQVISKLSAYIKNLK